MLKLNLFTIRCFIFSLSLEIIVLLNCHTEAFKLFTLKHTKARKNPPEIVLSGYKEVDSIDGTYADKQFLFQNEFENDFVAKRGSDYLMCEDISKIVFTCEADYPITWTFPFPEQLPKEAISKIASEEQRISEFTPSFSEPQNIRFKNQIQVTLTGIEFMSLNVTCVSKDNMNPELQSSIHIFLRGINSLEHEGETLTVPTNLINDQLVLPCRPSSPNVTVGLGWKSTKAEWKPFGPFNDLMSFDPKIGFILKENLLQRIGMSGFFRCFVKTNDNDSSNEGPDTHQEYVYINVTKTLIKSNYATKKSNENESSYSKSNVYGKANFSISSSTTLLDSFVCCSGVPKKPPRLIIQGCRSTLQCRLVKQAVLTDSLDTHKQDQLRNFILEPNSSIALRNAGCVKQLLLETNEMVICQGDNIDVAGMYIMGFNQLIQGAVQNRTQRFKVKPEKVNLLKGFSQYSLTQYMNSELVAANSKMALLVGKFMRKRDRDFPKSLTIHFAAKHTLPFEGDGFKSISIDELLLMSDLQASKKRSRVIIAEYDRDVYYVGEPLLFFCLGVKSFYALGPHLTLNWKNGTKSMLGQSDNPVVSNLENSKKLVYLSNGADMFYGEGKRTQNIFGEPVLATQEMVSVDCWMPLVESSRWDKTSKQIRVLPSIAPKFLEKEEETMYVYLGEEGRYITCTVTEAKPFPKLKVLWDGKNVQLNWGDLKKLRKEQKHKDGIPSGSETVDKVNNLVDIKIDFHDKIEHAYHSTIQCIATNVNKTVTRTIHVIVIDKPSLAHPILLSIVGVLGIVLIGLGIKYWYDKKVIRSIRN